MNVVTPHRLTTRGFPPTRNTNSKLGLLGLHSSLQSIRAAHDGSDASDYTNLLLLIFTPGPMVEAATQLLTY